MTLQINIQTKNPEQITCKMLQQRAYPVGQTRLREAFVSKLKQQRVKKKMSQDQLAREAGLTFKTISNYEAAKGFPRLENLSALGEALDVPPCYLCPFSRTEYH